MASHASLSMCSWVPWCMFQEHLVVLEVCCWEPAWLFSMRKVYVFGYIICTERILFSRCSLPQLVWPLNFPQQNLAQAKATWRKISLDSPWPVGFTLGSSFTSKRHQDEDARFGHGRVPLMGRCRCWDIPKEYPKMKVLLLRPFGLGPVPNIRYPYWMKSALRWQRKGSNVEFNGHPGKTGFQTLDWTCVLGRCCNSTLMSLSTILLSCLIVPCLQSDLFFGFHVVSSVQLWLRQNASIPDGSCRQVRGTARYLGYIYNNAEAGLVNSRREQTTAEWCKIEMRDPGQNWPNFDTGFSLNPWPHGRTRFIKFNYVIQFLFKCSSRESLFCSLNLSNAFIAWMLRRQATAIKAISN